MGYFVYIIKSLADHSYYKGFSEDPFKRLHQHNQGLSKYTSSKMPWELVYVELFSTKRDALIREKKLKKYSNMQVDLLIVSLKNLLNT